MIFELFYELDRLDRGMQTRLSGGEMHELDILVIGGGIGGLTAAIALRAEGHRVP
jgi:glycerol-3-phosphate dehydrogenase